MNFEILQILPIIVALTFFVLSYGRKHSPIALLLNVVSSVASRSWTDLSSKKNTLTEEQVSFANTALKFLSNRSTRLLRVEEEKKLEKEAAFWSKGRIAEEPKRTKVDEFTEDVKLLAQSILAVTTIGILIVSIGYATYEFLLNPLLVISKIIESLSQLFLEMWPIILTCILFFIISNTFLRKIPEHVLVSGYMSTWAFHSINSYSECEREKELLLNMMKSEEAPGSNSSQAVDDPDLDVDVSQNIPLKPGIAEIALTQSETGSIENIRNYLSSTRRFHKTLVWVSLSLLALSILGTLTSVFWGIEDAISPVLGGVGIGAVLATFSYKSASQARVAQIAMALFESHVSELQSNLSEANHESDPKHRRDLRADSWNRFRIGLNKLWELENKKEKQKITESGSQGH